MKAPKASKPPIIGIALAAAPSTTGIVAEEGSAEPVLEEEYGATEVFEVSSTLDGDEVGWALLVVVVVVVLGNGQ